jgi:hypothetical protein
LPHTSIRALGKMQLQGTTKETPPEKQAIGVAAGRCRPCRTAVCSGVVDLGDASPTQRQCGGGGGSTTSTSSEPALAAGAPDATTQQTVNVADSPAVVQVALGEKVSETRVGRRLFEYVYNLSATGGAQAVQGIVAKRPGGGAGMTVVQGTVRQERA